MLRIRNVQKSFGDFLAVKKANLDVKKGEIVAVIGPNGGGQEYLVQIDKWVSGS